MNNIKSKKIYTDSDDKKTIMFTIPLNPIPKKNNGQIIQNKKKDPLEDLLAQRNLIDKDKKKNYKLIPSKKYLEYVKDAQYFVKAYRINRPVNVKALFYRKTRGTVDLTNLNEGLHDLLVERGCLEDDNQHIIVSTDGSRVLYDKENPRTEVTIEFYPDDFQDPFR